MYIVNDSTIISICRTLGEKTPPRHGVNFIKLMKEQKFFSNVRETSFLRRGVHNPIKLATGSRAKFVVVTCRKKKEKTKKKKSNVLPTV